MAYKVRDPIQLVKLELPDGRAWELKDLEGMLRIDVDLNDGNPHSHISLEADSPRDVHVIHTHSQPPQPSIEDAIRWAFNAYPKTSLDTHGQEREVVAILLSRDGTHEPILGDPVRAGSLGGT